MNRFRIHVIARILLSLGFGAAAIYFAAYTPFWLLSGWMALFFILLIISLIRFVERSDRDLSNFLLAIRQNDFTNTYPQVGKNTKRLYQAFNLITSEFIRIRNEKESNFHFLKTVVEHSGVPLLAFEVTSEKISLINQSLKDLFHLPHFTLLNSLDRVDKQLAPAVREMAIDDRLLLKVMIGEELTYLSIQAKELVLQGEKHKVVAFHDINSELDQKEVEAWQKLIRVMTHEIKNSVIPISTLAEVMNDMVTNDQGKSRLDVLDQEDEEDLLVSMKTIEKRSKGLVKFVTSYGDLAKVPKPQFELSDLSVLVKDVVALEQKQLEKAGITITFQASSTVNWQLSIDPGMIEQVVINLIKNAQEALKETHHINGKIDVQLLRHAHEVELLVRDNGPGIDQETLDQIFIPFFTTKKEGSGIGLSYSKQVMRAHKGNLKVKSRLGEGTTFILRFWKTQ
ncbi:sensor histidine kinase [Marinoscillum sp.]|uniref:sensor histidine kinase n=1 Tax=Marinoscillum sp. TaxID=2024838 RepID=UPI003BAAC1CB